MSPPQRSLLSRPQILRHREEGTIIIEPFFPDLLKARGLNTASYDVRLGPYFFREQRGIGDPLLVFNPLSQHDVRRLWGGVERAENAGHWKQRTGQHLENIRADDFIIVIKPGETILAHTIEFIGGRRSVTTEMRARSSLGRMGITVCKCAGWGDVGYFNRWTMEVTNVLDSATLVLPVGMRVAQIAFYEVDPLEESYVSDGGSYQGGDDLAELMERWTPDAMLPRLFRDADIVDGFRRFVPEAFINEVKGMNE